ncbi:MAG: DUF4352 domain-containing protein [Acidobacteria bacterium]|nr:DUF4352 domain-containing protein [Acidobacteriota bacterium]
MSMKFKPYAITAAALVGIGLLLATYAGLNRRNQTVGLNQEIQYDDFGFAVLGTVKANAVGGYATQHSTEGQFYLVTLKVTNHAQRVNYRFNKSAAILVDESGREYPISSVGQKALDGETTPSGGCESELPPGASCVADLVFELPKAARLAYVRISEGGAVGDVLDTIFYGKKMIKVGE